MTYTITVIAPGGYRVYAGKTIAEAYLMTLAVRALLPQAQITVTRSTDGAIVNGMTREPAAHAA